MEQSILQQDLFWWVMSLVVGLPLLILLLGEVIERLELRENPLARGLRQVRHGIVPLLTVLLLLRAILNLPNTTFIVQVVETCFWIAVIYVGVGFFAQLAEVANINVTSWLASMPKLLFAFGRASVILLGGYYLFTFVWGIDISNIVAALGVGSLVIALALQDTLSNLVSGLLLIVDRPFQVGDRLKVGDIEGDVIDLNWRAVRLKTLDRDMISIPNGLLGNEIIHNYSRPTTIRRLTLTFSFSYDDRPNRVRKMLLEVARAVDGVRQKPPPRAFVSNYNASGIEYKLQVFVNTIKQRRQVRHTIMARIYYAAKRYGITIPYPIQMEYRPDDLLPTDPTKGIKRTLRQVPLFKALDHPMLDQLVASATVSDYGRGEPIVYQGEEDEGFYVIRRGRVRLFVEGKAGRSYTIAQITRGDIFGEAGILQDEASHISATAVSDTQVIIIPDALMSQLIRDDPIFAREVNTFLSERDKTIQAIMGDDRVSQRADRNGYFDLIRS